MKPYPKYKDSGVEWLGQVPEGWGVKRIKYTSSLNPTKDNFIDKESVELVTFLPMENVSEAGQIYCETKRTISSLWTGFTYFRKNDIIIAKITPCFENGKGALLNELDMEFGFGSTEFHVLRALNNVLPSFLFYITRSYQFRVLGEAFMTGAAGQKRVSTDFIENFIVGLPPIQEQTAIANYLDRKTAEIDCLITNKERLIELYEEEKTAVINQAVTKGLNHDAPMKPSGIDWLGDIPEHWEVKRLKHIAQVRQGVTKGRDLTGKEVIEMPYLRVANVQDGYLDLAEITTISILKSELERFSLRRGDVLMNEGGDNDKLGRGTIWNEEVVPCLHQNHVFCVRPEQLEFGQWISIWTQGTAAKFYFFICGKQTTNLASISSTGIKELPIPVPSLPEQASIVQHIETECRRLDAIIGKFKKQIELLKEYRTTLISEVVTGKIDVRDEVVP